MVKPSTRTRVIFMPSSRLTPNVMYTLREFNHGDDLLVGQMEPLHNLVDTAIRRTGQIVSGETLAHLSPLKWEHINLTAAYPWRKDARLRHSLTSTICPLQD